MRPSMEIPRLTQGRQAVVRALDEALYAKSLDENSEEFEEILRQNGSFYNNLDSCCYFRAENHYLFGTPKKTPTRVNPVHPSLQPRMVAYLHAKRELQKERDLGLGYVRLALTRFTNFDDLTKVLPKQLNAYIAHLRGYFEDPQEKTSEDTAEQFTQQHKAVLNFMRTRIAYNMFDTD